MLEHEWKPTKLTTQNHELEDGLQKDNYLTWMPWIHPQEEPGEGLWDPRKSIIIYLQTHQEEVSCKEEEEEDVIVEILGK